MQRGNYEKKLEAMRAYAKTPAGIASKAKSQAKWLAKRKEHAEQSCELKVNPQPLLKVISNWTSK